MKLREEIRDDQMDLGFPRATLSLAVRYVEHSRLRTDPAQPRKEADQELRDSIRANGLLQPITVRPDTDGLGVDERYIIVDGERRWRGAAGILETIAVVVRDDLDERIPRLRTQVVANVGKPLTPIEEARAFQELLPEHESIAALARSLGRPDRTVQERLKLLELGPWLSWIEDGRLPLSHAVKYLLPLAGCPDEVHAHALGLVEKNGHVAQGATAGNVIGSSHFGSAVHEGYRGAMYPLTKTKTTYDKQPTFDTRAHDQECDCGRIQFDLGSAKRACCGNPAWWRSRDRAAKKSAPAKKKSSGGRSQLRYYLPEGAKEFTHKGYDAPKSLVLLTGDSGKWSSNLKCDPSLLVLDPSKLVLLKRQYHEPCVATKDLDVVREARKAWAQKWTDRRAGVVGALETQLKDKAKSYRVSGPGVGELLAHLELRGNDREGVMMMDVADALGLEVPTKVRQMAGDWRGTTALAQWAGGLDEEQASAVASGLAYLLGSKTQTPTAKVAAEEDAALKKIEQKAVPWRTAPKGSKTTKPARSEKRGSPTAEAVPVPALEEEDLEDEEWA